MRIKFVGLEATEGQNAKGTWTGVKIMGTRLDDGSPWSSSVLFHSNPKHKDWITELETTDQGTPIDVKHIKDGKFWKMSDILIGDDVNAKYEEQEAKVREVKASYKPAPSSVRRADGGTRGDDTNRSAAIYLAKEYVSEYGPELFVIAQDILGFIKDGVVPSTGDPLAPPKEE